MGLGATTIRHILLLINFFFAILAIILIGFGIFALVSAENAVHHGENTVGGLSIAVGVVILVIAIFGSLAAIRESRVKLIIYCGILVVLILIKLIMLSMASHGTADGLSGSIREGFEKLWEEEHRAPGSLAYYEDGLHCCGVNGTDDYHRIQHDMPKSCCKHHNCLVVANIYTEGCQSKFEAYLAEKLLALKIVAWILIVAEAAGAILGWMMFSSLKNQSRRRNVGWM